jgi:hypothetical protein
VEYPDKKTSLGARAIVNCLQGYIGQPFISQVLSCGSFGWNQLEERRPKCIKNGCQGLTIEVIAVLWVESRAKSPKMAKKGLNVQKRPKMSINVKQCLKMSKNV